MSYWKINKLLKKIHYLWKNFIISTSVGTVFKLKNKSQDFLGN